MVQNESGLSVQHVLSLKCLGAALGHGGAKSQVFENISGSEGDDETNGSLEEGLPYIYICPFISLFPRLSLIPRPSLFPRRRRSTDCHIQSLR